MILFLWLKHFYAKSRQFKRYDLILTTIKPYRKFTKLFELILSTMAISLTLVFVFYFTKIKEKWFEIWSFHLIDVTQLVQWCVNFIKTFEDKKKERRDISTFRSVFQKKTYKKSLAWDYPISMPANGSIKNCFPLGLSNIW